VTWQATRIMESGRTERDDGRKFTGGESWSRRGVRHGVDPPPWAVQDIPIRFGPQVGEDA
jgi:hypothetical protein